MYDNLFTIDLRELLNGVIIGIGAVVVLSQLCIKLPSGIKNLSQKQEGLIEGLESLSKEYDNLSKKQDDLSKQQIDLSKDHITILNDIRSSKLKCLQEDNTRLVKENEAIKIKCKNLVSENLRLQSMLKDRSNDRGLGDELER